MAEAQPKFAEGKCFGHFLLSLDIICVLSAVHRGKLSWQASYFSRTEHLNAWHHAVVLIVVGYNDSAFLLLGQNKLHVVLNVGSGLDEGGIDRLRAHWCPQRCGLN